MKKIKFLKDHLDNKEKEIAEATDERANYLVNVGVAEYYIDKPKKDKK